MDEMDDEAAEQVADQVVGDDDNPNLGESAARIRVWWTGSVQNFIAIGQELNRVRDEEQFGKYGHFTEWVKQALPFKLGTAERLMLIASNPVLANSAHAPNLPPCWTTLYEIAKAFRDREADLEEAIKDGRVNADMERADVGALRLKDQDEVDEEHNAGDAADTVDEAKEVDEEHKADEEHNAGNVDDAADEVDEAKGVDEEDEPPLRLEQEEAEAVLRSFLNAVAQLVGVDPRHIAPGRVAGWVEDVKAALLTGDKFYYTLLDLDLVTEQDEAAPADPAFTMVQPPEAAL